MRRTLDSSAQALAHISSLVIHCWAAAEVVPNMVTSVLCRGCGVCMQPCCRSQRGVHRECVERHGHVQHTAASRGKVLSMPRTTIQSSKLRPCLMPHGPPSHGSDAAPAPSCSQVMVWAVLCILYPHCTGVRGHLPLQLPGHDPAVDVPHCMHHRQHLCAEALREGPWSLHDARRACS